VLTESMEQSTGFVYMGEVYVDNFMSLVIPVSKAVMACSNSRDDKNP
jgi:hypothetical protein